ncbi:glycosyltransferase family 1 protein [cf. Phormidesmis sp. LEGE 11477]|uniref:glycosyltransferase family 4 protein n=1 Tax=cf. Phormidesmis sp. LEGE 11477 TaxID=1828680 RepID=UPI001881B14F|nr:glycosyltransferase family 1 protein [cf. Phormidesmis sp. LEGE 11477]MBE9061254.1 glycosyltransferase family 4 protein [cf. Phormidesmis sp. LEGE 11477]
MHIAILRRVPRFSVSMDVYADGLIAGLKAVRPSWTISELHPTVSDSNAFKPLNGIQKYYERYWRYPNRLRQTKADIFHIIDHSDGYLSNWLCQDQQPNVVTCHDLINLIQPETFRGRAVFPWLSMTLWKQAVRSMRQADHVVAVSSHTKQDTVEHLAIAPQSITVVPNAVGSQFTVLPLDRRQRVRQNYEADTKAFCLLNIGSNNARKNISAILSAVEIAKDAGVPVRFWKAGADFTGEQKQFIGDRNLQNEVSYLGKLNETELIELYNAADCLTAPSLYEGFGLTILEAMACGTPVITANINAMPEVAGEAALLVNPTSIEEIAQAIQKLYNQPELANILVDKGLARVKNFTWEKTAEQVAQVYEQVLSQNKKCKD